MAACGPLCVSATEQTGVAASDLASVAGKGGAVPGEAPGPAAEPARGKGRAGAGETAARPTERDMEEQMKDYIEYRKKHLLNNIGRDVEIVVRGPVRFYTPSPKKQSR